MEVKYPTSLSWNHARTSKVHSNRMSITTCPLVIRHTQVRPLTKMFAISKGVLNHDYVIVHAFVLGVYFLLDSCNGDMTEDREMRGVP